MSARTGALQVLRRQRAAADRLRREVFGTDGSLRHPYFRDLRRQLKTWTRRVSPGTVLAACARADIVYVGDFHADPLCQSFAADLLAAAAARGPRPLLLGIEFLYTRQQPLLDARQQGRLSDPDFLRRVHYREEWGYPWDGFRALLDRARDLNVPVLALDAPPRGGFDGLGRRDRHAARRIASALSAHPRARMLVLFGESHLSPGHIPALVDRLLRRSQRELRRVTVFQDPDVLYWSLLREGGPVPAAVELTPGSFAIFRSTPLARYEAYRQVLDRWRGDVPAEEEVDLTPAVHHLIRSLLGWLGIRAERYRLRHRGGWGEDLVDAFPEVYGGGDAADLLRPILEDHGRTFSELREAERRFNERGALYDARSNTLFLSRYLPGHAAGEAARFLRAALSGRLFRAGEDETTPAAVRLYGAAYNEGLASLGARLLDPASGFTSGAAERRDPAATAWLNEHRAYERSSRVLPPLDLLDVAAASRTLRRAVARELGQRLGLILFDRVRSGAWTARELRAAFSRSLEGGRAARLVVGVLRAPGNIPL